MMSALGKICDSPWKTEGDHKSLTVKVSGVLISPSGYECVDFARGWVFSPRLNIRSEFSLANTRLQDSSPTECYGDWKF